MAHGTARATSRMARSTPPRPPTARPRHAANRTHAPATTRSGGLRARWPAAGPTSPRPSGEDRWPLAARSTRPPDTAISARDHIGSRFGRCCKIRGFVTIRTPASAAAHGREVNTDAKYTAASAIAAATRVYSTRCANASEPPSLWTMARSASSGARAVDSKAGLPAPEIECPHRVPASAARFVLMNGETSSSAMNEPRTNQVWTIAPASAAGTA